MDHGNQGKLAMEEFQVVLESYLTGVDADALTAMVKAAELELEAKDAEELDYKSLFLEVRNFFCNLAQILNLSSTEIWTSTWVLCGKSHKVCTK